MTQDPLFIDSLSDALASAIKQLGDVKKVGVALWPEKSPREAGSQLLNCLNPEHQQKLSLEQIDFIIGKAREVNNHDVMKYLCDRFGYEFKAITKEQVQATIANRIEAARNDILEALKEWEKIK